MAEQKQAPKAPQVFVSIDMEAFGPIPGIHPLKSVGMQAFALYFSENGKFKFEELSEGGIKVDLMAQEDEIEDERTMKWWKDTSPEGLKKLQEATMEFSEGARRLKGFLDDLQALFFDSKIVAVYYPTTFDGAWLDHMWLQEFGTHGPCMFLQDMDIQSYAAGCFGGGISYDRCRKSHLLDEFMPEIDKSQLHDALYDAKVQGRLFCNLMNARMHHSPQTRFTITNVF